MTLAGLARWCFRRRRLVLGVWLVLLVGLNVVGAAVGSAYSNNFNSGHSDSQAAFDLLRSQFRARAGDPADIVFTAPDVTARPVRDAMERLFAEVGPGRVPHVVAFQSPYTTPSRISPDKRVAYASATFDQQAGDLPAKSAKPLIDAAHRVKVPGLKIELGGEVVARALQPPQGPAELIGLGAAIVILFIAFGSLLAMGLPVMTAIFGVGIGGVFVTLFSHIITVPSFAPQVAFTIGLGVGIDYALLIVTRYRAGLHDGLSPEDATVLALTTSGRSTLFAGCTVIISLLGLFAIGVSFIYGLAIGAVAAVAMTMLASVTLLPAIMGFAGPKLAGKEKAQRHGAPSESERGLGGAPAGLALGLRPRLAHRSQRETRGHRESAAYRWSRSVQRRPWLLAGVSLAILVIMALPLFSLHLGVADHGNDPKSLTTRRAYDLLAQGFGPGSNGPVILAAEFRSETNKNTLARFVDARVRPDTDVAFVAPITFNQTGTTAVAIVIPKGAPQDRSTEKLVHRLRAELRDAGLGAHVGGVTAAFIDAGDRVGLRLRYMVTAVIILSFLLLMAVFRSVLVPLKAAIMNLLSVGAAYGVIVAIFQWGWLGSVVGIGRPGPIEFWVPMMLFTILFGLSMDYEVFLLSRVREEYLVHHDNATAVADGLAATARVITAAAAIMIAVFSSFIFGDLRVLKLLGLGVASAIFIDASLIRMVLVPATMELLGDANWWFPTGLERIVPRISVEAPPEFAPATPEPPAEEAPAAPVAPAAKKAPAKKTAPTKKKAPAKKKTPAKKAPAKKKAAVRPVKRAR
jgi:RND superfamily putative drug exporter